GLALAGALAVQALLIALLAWKVFSPPAAGESANDGKIVATLEKLDKSLSSLEARRRADLAEERARARTEFLDEAFGELKGGDSGSISRLQSRFDDSARLKDDVTARDAEIREMRTLIEDTRGKLQSMEVSAKRDESRFKSQIEDLTTENVRL